MRNEIVVGLDDSPSGEAALQWAAAEAIRSHAVLRPVLDHTTALASA